MVVAAALATWCPNQDDAPAASSWHGFLFHELVAPSWHDPDSTWWLLTGAGGRAAGQDLEGAAAAWRRSAEALRGCLLELEPGGRGWRRGPAWTLDSGGRAAGGRPGG
ncbi:hypothetical protein E2562_020700 [Oryza meyeriana var. granulata]|uniref:Uncharacterized protein n=1 Tax=Oryza meyeriana var. granulata TaxID=110450 RepID=A0A6G1EN21_9ORYZ|nr:hypothetical protein E2562_020700 [Oryza meyeriana var. granulata]